MDLRTNGSSDQWAVGPMGFRTNGSSDQWAVGLSRRPYLHKRTFYISVQSVTENAKTHRQIRRLPPLQACAWFPGLPAKLAAPQTPRPSWYFCRRRLIGLRLLRLAQLCPGSATGTVSCRWSDSPLVRRPIGSKTHWSEDPLVRKSVIGPKTHWSEKVSLVRQ